MNAKPLPEHKPYLPGLNSQFFVEFPLPNQGPQSLHIFSPWWVLSSQLHYVFFFFLTKNITGGGIYWLQPTPTLVHVSSCQLCLRLVLTALYKQHGSVWLFTILWIISSFDNGAIPYYPLMLWWIRCDHNHAIPYIMVMEWSGISALHATLEFTDI